jgi:hypothetical protein
LKKNSEGRYGLRDTEDLSIQYSVVSKGTRTPKMMLYLKNSPMDFASRLSKITFIAAVMEVIFDEEIRGARTLSSCGEIERTVPQ